MQFFFETLQTFFCPRKYEKNLSQKLLIISPIIFQLAPNQPKSHTLFHKNGSWGNFYIMTLATALGKQATLDLNCSRTCRRLIFKFFLSI